MSKTVIFHVGIHKTGTTSIQAYLGDNRERLKALGIDFYDGLHIRDNHVELHVAAMRASRHSPFKLDHDLVIDHNYFNRIRARVHGFADRSNARQLLFSAEGLSYLRHTDEMERLKSIVPSDDIRIVFYIRDRSVFLSSYRRELTRHTLPTVIDRDSFAYVAKDTWLIDFESRIGAFRAAFGDDRVTVVDYDTAMRTSGNVIPSFLEVLGVSDAFTCTSWKNVFMNRSRVAG